MNGEGKVRGGFKAVPVTDRIFWVGAIDWELRDFHGYSTSRGSTYNAYLVLGEGNILFDAVKEPFFDEMMARIASVVDPSSIRAVVSNHAEMDHTGSLARLFEAAGPAQVLASASGVRNLDLQMGFHPAALSAVGDGLTASVCGLDLTFIETKMLHWPDSMFTFLPSMNTLVSQDAFGMHLATPELFAFENDPAILLAEAARYYANIIMPYSPLVLKLLDRAASIGLDPDLVLPDHGPVWKKGTSMPPSWIFGRYAHWASMKPTDKAVIVYDTMWHATEKMAHAIADGVSAGGAVPRVHPMKSSHRSDIAADLLEAGALVAGSPTINNGLFPTLSDICTYLKGLRRPDLVGSAFGSYGWSGESVKVLSELLAGMKVTQVGENIGIQFGPDAAQLDRCRAQGLAIAAAISGARG